MWFDPLGSLAQSQPAPSLQFIDTLARTPLSKILIFVAVCTVIRFLVAPMMERTPPHRRTGIYLLYKFLNDATDALVYAGVIVFLVIRPFGVQTFFIPSQSMENTLKINDFIVANKMIYRLSEPKAGDIVVFRPPAVGLLPGQGQTDYIKRLIGTPGQVIEIRQGKLFRDGQMVEENFVTRGLAEWDFKLVIEDGKYVPVLIDPLSGAANSIPNMPLAEEFRTYGDIEREERLKALPPVAIPEGSLLMVGDNRNESYDGRSWGLASRRNLIGRSEFIWLPFSRIGMTR